MCLVTRAVASNKPTKALASVISIVFVVYTHHKHHKYPGKEWTDCISHVFHGHCLSHNFFSGYGPGDTKFDNISRTCHDNDEVETRYATETLVLYRFGVSL